MTPQTAPPEIATGATPTPRRARLRRGSGTTAFGLLHRRFDGALHRPGELGYEEARKALNPALDPHPSLVAVASGAEDVRLAVVAARELRLPFAIQATGHGTHVPADGALLVRTSRMKSVLVDPDRRVARVAAGAVWGDVLAAAAPFGLAPLSGSSPSVGVVGFTLGGGVGWLSRKHGFAADSVLRADVVTADGRIVTASHDQHPELFWALRGGGGSFGIVTSLEFKLHPVDAVYAGTSYFAIDRAAETLARYREWTATAPDEISTALLITRPPDTPEVPEAVRGRTVLAIRAMYAGGAEDATRLLAPLVEAAGPTLAGGFRAVRYAEAAMGGTPPRQLDLVDNLPAPLIESLLATVEDESSPLSTVEIRHWAGAIGRGGPSAGPAGHRAAPFSVVADAAGPSVLGRYATGRSFLNFLADPARTASAYTEANHRRLREVKASYDPANVFSLGHAIPA